MEFSLKQKLQIRFEHDEYFGPFSVDAICHHVQDDRFTYSLVKIGGIDEQSKNMGLDIDKIYWRGFSSQGDGACFIGSWKASDVKTGETAKDWGDSPETKEIRRIASEFEQFAKNWPESYFSVTHSGHYWHEYCTDFDVSLGETEGVTPEESDSIIETARDYMRWIYKQLEKEYEYQNSDECVDENITNNDYTFLICGKRED